MNLSTESMLSGQGGLYVRLLVIVSLSFVFLYIIYGAIWRLYFSPIAHIPGPRLAALTFWNETYYDIVLGGKYTWKIAEYHKSYGELESTKVLLAARINRSRSYHQNQSLRGSYQ